MKQDLSGEEKLARDIKNIACVRNIILSPKKILVSNFTSEAIQKLHTNIENSAKKYCCIRWDKKKWISADNLNIPYKEESQTGIGWCINPQSTGYTESLGLRGLLDDMREGPHYGRCIYQKFKIETHGEYSCTSIEEKILAELGNMRLAMFKVSK